MSKVENSVAYAEKMAADNSHGYDQVHRWGDPDFDCSGLVITALEVGGIPAKSCGATYTGNMYEKLKEAGMQDVTASVNLSTQSGLQRGDVLLTPNHHTVMYCGNGKVVGARINENGNIKGGQPGDQNDKEVCVHNYYNYPWTYVLRYIQTQLKSELEIANDIYHEVGEWKGCTGENRKSKLTSMGYSYSNIQKILNDMMNGSTPTQSAPVPKITFEEVVTNTIRGRYGIGHDNRKPAIEALGFNYEEVKAEVNRRFK